VGKNETHLLNLKDKDLNIKIERQVTFSPYVVDGYCQEINTIFEVYEKYHDKTAEYDLKRQRELMQQLHCDFVIIPDRSH
jgi:very-short-patch-repair endonuclease